MMSATALRKSAAAILLLVCGCATRLAAPAGEAVPDPAGFVTELRESTLPETPQQITFGWTLAERGSRVRGRGVVRAEAPDRIRLDLFGQRGESYLSAALVYGQFRFPGQVPPDVELPSPALLWAALGVLQPPDGATVTSATATDGTAEVRYAVAPDESLAYTFERPAPAEPYRLVRLQRATGRDILETVSLTRAADGSLARANYRDWTAYRDLILDVESIRSTDAFPPDIWSPDVI